MLLSGKRTNEGGFRECDVCASQACAATFPCGLPTFACEKMNWLSAGMVPSTEGSALNHTLMAKAPLEPAQITAAAPGTQVQGQGTALVLWLAAEAVGYSRARL